MSALQTYRENESKTREDLATELGVDPTTIWRWETGAVKVPVDRLAEIEQKTRISRAALRPDIFGTAA